MVDGGYRLCLYCVAYWCIGNKMEEVLENVPDKYHLQELKEKSLANVQGRSKATMQLMRYLEEKK